MGILDEKLLSLFRRHTSNINQHYIAKTSVVDNCASTDKTAPLSANQGAELQKQINDLKQSSGGGGYVAQDNAPDNTSVLWIDTANGGIIKYHNGTGWVATAAVWG